MDEKFLYFEPQTAALCGVHALNTLLGGPVFTEWELAQIAQDLDKLEKEIMGEDFDHTQSANVDASGMFSIQVLQKALAVHNLDIVPLSSPDVSAAKSDPSSQTAFLCNLDEHWFTIKKVYDEWWNFDSTKPAPAPVGTFYLSAFLATLQEQGYSIFLVQGELPKDPHPDMGAEDMNQGKWFSPHEAREAVKQSEQVKKQGFARAAANALLGKAAFGKGATYTLRPHGQTSARLSKILRNGGTSSTMNEAYDDDDDDDLALALAASMEDMPATGNTTTINNKRQRSPRSGISGENTAATTDNDEDDEDEDLAAAIAASLQASGPQQQQQQQQQQHENGEEMMTEEDKDTYKLPELDDDESGAGKGEDGGVIIEVGLRLPGGGRSVRKFHKGQHTVGHLVAFAVKEGGLSPDRIKVALQFPHRELCDWVLSLEEAGIGDKEVVVVVLK